MRTLLLITCFFLLLSCDREALRAPVPWWVAVPEVTLNSSISGDAQSHKFTELWVYVDSIFMGAYPIPGDIPILSDQDQVTLELFVGIRNNGQSTAPILYPLMQRYTLDLMLTGGGTTILPAFTYRSDVQVAFFENFEIGNLFREDLDLDLETSLQISNSTDLFNRAARGVLTADHHTLEVASAFEIDGLPSNGTPIYLELDYLSEVPLAVGIRGIGSGNQASTIYKIALFPTDFRDKIYLDFAPEVQQFNTDRFQLTFLARFDENLASDSQFVMLDNIKLLHF